MKTEVMTFSDLSEVARLAGQLGYPCELQDVIARFQIASARNDVVLFTVKDSDGQVRGWAQANLEMPSLLADRRAELAALVVDEEFRGKGLGRSLVRSAELWAQSQGAKLVRLRSNMKRENAHKFYQREGYKILKSWHCFVKEI